MNEISFAKKVLRQKMSSPQVANSEKVLDSLNDWSTFQEADTVGSYIAMEDEVNLDVLLNASKKVFLPIYDKVNKNYRMAQVQHSKDLVEGKFGMLRTFRNMSISRCERHFPMVDSW